MSNVSASKEETWCRPVLLNLNQNSYKKSDKVGLGYNLGIICHISPLKHVKVLIRIMLLMSTYLVPMVFYMSGEKLSKSQLQSNTIIKKLRSKEKDNESTITTQKWVHFYSKMSRNFAYAHTIG